MDKKIKQQDWSENKKLNGKDRFYDYCELKTPLGLMLIEWKSWKSSPSYDITFNGQWIGCEYSLDDAKAYCLRYLITINSELMQLIYE